MVASHLQEILERHAGIKDIRKMIPIGGGSINEAMRIATAGRNYFLKMNSAVLYPGMFGSECEGLRLLSGAQSLFVPEPIASFTVEKTQYLLMEFIESGKRTKDFFGDFGRKLGKMHKQSQEMFGLDHDNYIGSLKQSNKLTDSWPAFFMDERIRPQCKLAIDSGKLPASIFKDLERLEKIIADIFPAEPPSLLHGDLWSGNFMTGPDGAAAIFDPAVYYGHREMDLAMTKLFGGFDQEFYDAYHVTSPLAPGWEDRVDVCNLYPLLVHVNLFGGGYATQVMGILKRH